MSFPSYPRYKDSAFVGLDLMPEHWERWRFKQVFEEINHRSKSGEEELLSVSEYYGVKPRSGKIQEGEHLSRAESLEGYKICEPGDLVMNIMLAWKRGLGVTDDYGIVSPAYAVFRLIIEADPVYYHYLLRSDEYIGYFKTFSSGVIDSRLRLYPEVFGRLVALVPPVEEQAQIACFLDHETAKIDALIREQERLIDLLQEKRQAVISDAVTKGLDPDVPMKDSGVEWLGEVPAHWTVKKLGYLTDVTKLTGFEYTNLWRTADDGEIIALRGFNIAERRLDLKNVERIDSGLSERLTRSKLESGDIVLPCTGSLGNAALITENSAYHINQNIAKVRTTDKSLVPEFLVYWLTSSVFKIFLDWNNTSAMQPVLLIGDIRNSPVTVPPVSEQRSIVDQLDSVVARFNVLVQEASEGIKLLKERRSALISAAVTGKIDVRNWKPPADESAFNEEVRRAGLEATA